MLTLTITAAPTHTQLQLHGGWTVGSKETDGIPFWIDPQMIDVTNIYWELERSFTTKRKQKNCLLSSKQKLQKLTGDSYRTIPDFKIRKSGVFNREFSNWKDKNPAICGTVHSTF